MFYFVTRPNLHEIGTPTATTPNSPHHLTASNLQHHFSVNVPCSLPHNQMTAMVILLFNGTLSFLFPTTQLIYLASVALNLHGYKKELQGLKKLQTWHENLLGIIDSVILIHKIKRMHIFWNYNTRAQSMSEVVLNNMLLKCMNT
jgi:hypothetical protein